jgi:hypothetical protein
MVLIVDLMRRLLWCRIRVQFLGLEFLAPKKRHRSSDRRGTDPGRASSCVPSNTGVWQFRYRFVIVLDRRIAAVLGAGTIVAAASPGTAVVIYLTKFSNTFADTLKTGGTLRASVIRVWLINAAFNRPACPRTADAFTAFVVGFAGFAFEQTGVLDDCTDVWVTADQALAAVCIVLARITLFRARRFWLGASALDADQAVTALEFGVTHFATGRDSAEAIDAFQAIGAALSTLGTAVSTLAGTFRLRELAGTVNTLEPILATKEPSSGFPDEADISLRSALGNEFFADALFIANTGTTGDLYLAARCNQSAVLANLGTWELARPWLVANQVRTAPALSTVSSKWDAPCLSATHRKVRCDRCQTSAN